MSGRKIADLLIKVGADNYEFQQRIREVDKSLGTISKKWNKLGKELSAKLTAPLLAIGGAAVYMADEEDRASAKVQQAIKSTAAAAKLSFEQLKSYASELQNKTIFGDEQILNEATAQLLTFTNIAGDNFKRAQKSAMDVATVLDGDLKSASIQLGKALNDPVKNLSALSRSGIQFSKEQKNVINSLAETGRIAEAQGVILSELERQYGGQAEARAKAGAGALLQLKNSWSDFMEMIGQTIIPMLQPLVKSLQEVVMWLQNLSPETRKVIVVIGGLAAAIGPVTLAIGGVLKMIPLMKAGLLTMLNPVTLGIAAFAMLAAAIYGAVTAQDRAVERFTNQRVGKGIYQVETLDLAQKDFDEEQKKVGNLKSEIRKLKDSLIYNDAHGNNPSTKERKSIRAEIKILEKELSVRENLATAKYKAIQQLVSQRDEQNRASQNVAASITEQGKEVQKVMEDLLGVISDQNKGNGLIAKLEAEINKLQLKLVDEKELSKIAVLNTEIEKLTEQLNALRAITSKTLATRAVIKEQGEVLGSMGLATIEAKVKVNIKPIVAVKDIEAENQFKESMKLLGSIDGDYFSKQYDKIVAVYQEKGAVFANQMAQNTVAVSEFMSAAMSGVLEGALTSVFTGVVDAISGGGINEALINILNSVTSMIGDFVTQLGVKLIMASEVMVAFKAAINSLLANPAMALAAGLAMLAVGMGLKMMLQNSAESSAPKLAKGGLAFGPTYAMVGDNPGARVDPEVIAPLSKLKAMLPGGGSQRVSIELKGKLKADGRDLAVTIERNNYKMSVINGKRG